MIQNKSIKVQLCTCSECKAFQPQRPSSVGLTIHSFKMRCTHVSLQTVQAYSLSLEVGLTLMWS